MAVDTDQGDADVAAIWAEITRPGGDPARCPGLLAALSGPRGGEFVRLGWDTEIGAARPLEHVVVGATGDFNWGWAPPLWVQPHALDRLAERATRHAMSPRRLQALVLWALAASARQVEAWEIYPMGASVPLAVPGGLFLGRVTLEALIIGTYLGAEDLRADQYVPVVDHPLTPVSWAAVPAAPESCCWLTGDGAPVTVHTCSCGEAARWTTSATS